MQETNKAMSMPDADKISELSQDIEICKKALALLSPKIIQHYKTGDQSNKGDIPFLVMEYYKFMEHKNSLTKELCATKLCIW